MSFLNKMKRAMGFGAADTDEDEALYADSDTESAAAPPTPSDKEPAPAAPAAPLPQYAFDAVRRDTIFALVVEEFNKALPEFLAKAVDPERQRRMLLGKLDDGIAAYLDSLSQLARLHSESMWKERQDQLSAQLEAVKQRAEEIERQAAEVRQKQLSADRQKRALTDRTHDLETQLARSESEREQYELENRSLVNRLKVAGIVGEDVEKLRAENDELRRKLFRVGNTDGNSEATNEAAAFVAEEIASLTDRLGKETERADRAEKSVAEAEGRAGDAAARIAALEQQLQTTEGRLKATSEELAEHKQVVDNLGKLEETLTSQDAKIRSQRKQLDARDNEIAELKARLQKVEDEGARKEKELMDEIRSLRDVPAPGMEIRFDVVSEPEAPCISEDDLDAIEASFESGEWFTKNPPPETPSMRRPENEEYGYHAPRRKPTPADNPNQLSLF